MATLYIDEAGKTSVYEIFEEEVTLGRGAAKSRPRALAASSKDAWVRVELSKNRLMCARPRRTSRRFSAWGGESAFLSARSRRNSISGAVSFSVERRWRCARPFAGF